MSKISLRTLKKKGKRAGESNKFTKNGGRYDEASLTPGVFSFREFRSRAPNIVRPAVAPIVTGVRHRSTSAFSLSAVVVVDEGLKVMGEGVRLLRRSDLTYSDSKWNSSEGVSSPSSCRDRRAFEIAWRAVIVP